MSTPNPVSQNLLDPYLKLMAEKEASDLYFTTGAPPSMKVQGALRPLSKSRLEPGMTKKIAYSMLTEKQMGLFEDNLELNLGVSKAGLGRFRVNFYMQRGEVSMVIRYIKGRIPKIEELGLPMVLKDLVMNKNGLLLMVGATGSGKSTTLAAMIDYRNETHAGHILTIEDPIEYVYQHKKSIIGQREIGLDTHSYENALREAMREAPDVILIGEVRDLETMEAAITYADTGHLCLSTLHAVNANQALDRVINLFPPQQKNQILMDLSLNLRAVVSQRLVPSKSGGRIAAVEVMINTPHIAELIRKGELGGIKETMEKAGKTGMQTFDQSLFILYSDGKIDLEQALAFADSRTNLEWKINFGGGMDSGKKKEPTRDMPTIDQDELEDLSDELGDL
ncbi:MAG: PilT/PilU family type 4a pilus ATPase [Gammaproteobacteria bacterium]|nr:PilT/PilU family type 4a pilus ATPase [Gammaproteobacteria bacterium]